MRTLRGRLAYMVQRKQRGPRPLRVMVVRKGDAVGVDGIDGAGAVCIRVARDRTIVLGETSCGIDVPIEHALPAVG